MSTYRLSAILLPALLIRSLAAAQIPDEFENLQLLPKDINKGQLVGTMRGWATALGVRCTHCHVGPDNLVGMDFASDDKATKRTARKMLEMVRSINKTSLADLAIVEAGRQHQQVSCYTCHRGVSTPPRSIEIAFDEVAASDGVDAAITAYRKLREEHFGAGHYDFSEQRLSGLGQGLMESGKPLEGVTVLEMGLEYYPRSAVLNAVMAMAFTAAGELERAQSALDTALELDPENRMAGFAKQQLDEARKR